MLRRHALVGAAVAIVASLAAPGHATTGYGSHADWSDGKTISGVPDRQTKITESSCLYLNGTKNTSATQDVVCTFVAVADTRIGQPQQGECTHTDSDTGGYRTISSSNCSASITARFEYTCTRAAASCHGSSDDATNTTTPSFTFQYTSPDGVNVSLGSGDLRATMKHNIVTVTGAAATVSTFDTFLNHVVLTFPCSCKPGGATPHYGKYAGSLLFGRVFTLQ
jgi:hypothetical protein